MEQRKQPRDPGSLSEVGHKPDQESADRESRDRQALDSVRALARTTQLSAFWSIVFAALLVFSYWPFVDHRLTLMWATGLTLAAVSRLLWVRQRSPTKQSTPEDLRQALRIHVVSTIVIGGLWGSSAWLFEGASTGILAHLYLLVLVGLIAGGSAAYSVYLPASVGFMASICVVAASRLMLSGGEHIWLAFMLLAFTGLLIRLVFTANELIGRLMRSRWKYRVLADSYREKEQHQRQLTGRILAETERSDALEASLHEKNLILRSVVGQAPIAVLLINTESHILDVFGDTIADLEQALGPLGGQSIYEAFSHNPAILQACRDALSGRKKITVTRIGERDIEFIATPFSDRNDEQLGMLLVGMDVSEEARLRRLQQEFVVHVNHQLRTPLTTIMASLEMLVDADLDLRAETRDELLTSAARSARRMQRLIETIDNLEAQTTDDHQQQVVAQDISTMTRHMFQEIRDDEPKHLAISDQLQEFGRLDISVGMLENVIAALLRNALKFGRDNSTIEVNIVNEHLENRHLVVIGVVNQCDPIPEQQQVHLFEKFSVGDSTDSRLHYGLGLGLYSIRKLLDQIGGRVWLESSTAQGTEFRVSLPLKLDATSRATRETA